MILPKYILNITAIYHVAYYTRYTKVELSIPVGNTNTVKLLPAIALIFTESVKPFDRVHSTSPS